MTGEEAKEACGTEKLCGGLEDGIKGGINVVRLLWQKNAQEKNLGFLLIDAHNAFNEENHKATLWAVCHKWSSGVRSAFNCYRHWATLPIRECDRTGHFL